MHHKSCLSREPQLRSSWQKLALFFFFTRLCLLFHFDWCGQIRPNAHIFLLERDSTTGSTLLSAWRLRKHEQLMKHVDATITFSRRCKSLGRIDTELAYKVNQQEQYWKPLLQRLVYVVKFAADRGWRLEEMTKTLDRLQNFSKKNFKKFLT